MKISLLIIGDEVLLGQVIDTNSSTIAKLLYKEGLEINKKWTVADREEEILMGLSEASSQSDVILMTGGLGPTKDDITKKAIAKFLNRELVFSEANKSHLTMMLNKRNIPVTPLHMEQCYLPADAEVLDNQMGTALGMWIEHNEKIFICMPGVPYEMEYIMIHGALPRLKTMSSGLTVVHQTIHTVGMGETEIADIIEPKLSAYFSEISLAYLPSQGQVKLRLTGKHTDPDYIEARITECRKIIDNCLPAQIIGYGETSLENEIGKLLRQKNKSLSIAESCTGGYLAHKITSVAGSSDYFKGCIVAYQNEIKQNQLKVSEQILNQHGAVSEECVREMVKGALVLFNSDYAIATSGIAGPGGGTPEKPVGTVWLAYGDVNLIKTRKFLFSRDRQRNIEATATFALIEFWKFLKNSL
jgi:nicotinamide-nucleotide amidase